MKRNPSALGTNETIVAEKNHYMLINYLRAKNLPEDEFYDVIALGYINGIKKYCRRPDLQGYALSTIVFRAMDTAYSNYIRYKECPKRKAVVYSMSDNINSYQTYEDVIADTKNGIESLIDSLSLDETLKSFNSTQQKIIKLLLDGYRYSEIAKMLNMSVNSFSEQINAICEIANSGNISLAA